MTEALWLAVIQFAVKFGLDAAIAIIRGINTSASIDDAITALELAKTKSAQQYLDEAKPV